MVGEGVAREAADRAGPRQVIDGEAELDLYGGDKLGGPKVEVEGRHGG